MRNLLTAISVIALLAACDDRSVTETTVDPGTGDEGGTPAVGGATASLGDINAGTLDGDVVTVVVPLDGEDTVQEYALNGALNGYNRFDQQETPINRAFTAIAGTSSTNNELVAIVTMDGGQFNRFYGGALLEQGSFSAPTSGFVYFNGDYAGLVNVGGPAVPAPGPGTPPEAVPSAVGEVTGTVYMIGDFTDARTEGVIFDREADFGGDAIALDNVVLINTDIASDGTFNGNLEIADLTGVGAYNGAFGGENATYLGGIVEINDGAYEGVFGDVDTSTLREYGLFILGQCDPASCFTPTP